MKSPKFPESKLAHCDQSKKRNILKTMGVFEGVWFLGLGFPYCFVMNCSSKLPGAMWPKVYLPLNLFCVYHFIDSSKFTEQA